MNTEKSINEAECNAVLPLVGRSFYSGQKIIRNILKIITKILA